MNKKETSPASRCTAALLLLFSLLAAVLGFAMPVQAAGNYGKALRTVRVGYYAYTGYNMMDADGNRSGYAYDMLQRIGQCENVQFEYLGYDGDTKQAMTMLENGEVDLIPVLRRTEERDERFAFSAEPIGSVATMLTVRAGNRAVAAGNYDTFDGMTVGMTRSGNGRNESFFAYAREHDFTCTPVYFDTDLELSNALQSGLITAAVSNRMRQTKNEWIIDTFDVQDSYIAVRKGDAPTLRLVNNAIAAMNRDNPSWRTTLFNKYYTGSHTSSKSHRMLFCNSHIEKPLWARLFKSYQSGSLCHRSRDRYNILMCLSKLHHLLRKNIGVTACLFRGKHLTGYPVKRRNPMEIIRVPLRIAIAFSFFRLHMNNNRFIQPECMLKCRDHLIDIMSVNWSDIRDSKLLEKHARHKKLFDIILRALQYLRNLLSGF